LTQVADAGGNLITVSHLREGVPLHVRETGVDLVLETRGEDHAAEILAASRGPSTPVPRSWRRSAAPDTTSRASTAAATSRRRGERGGRARARVDGAGRAAAPAAVRDPPARRDRGGGARAPRHRRQGHGHRVAAEGARGDARPLRAS